MVRWEILDGLPPYGPPAIPFPDNGYGLFREGLVVGFHDAHGRAWVGNFQRGINAVDRAIGCPSSRQVVIIAGGKGYLIDVERQCAVASYGAAIDYVEYIQQLDMIIVGDNVGFAAFHGDGKTWKSGRMSWDGIRNIVIDGTILRGEAWSPASGIWATFTLDLVTGKPQNSIYQEETANLIEIRRS